MAERTRPARQPRPGRPVSDLHPERPTLTTVRQSAADCQACDLYRRATQTVFGEGPRKAAFKVSRQRGEFVPSSLAPLVTATVHPSSILRARDDTSRRQEMAWFVRDLQNVAGKL